MMVRTGRLDTFLVRPRSVFTQVICSGTDPRRIACVAVGTTALIMGSKLSHVVWSPLKVLVLIESITMSCILILGLFMTEAIFSIFSVKSVEMVNVLTYGGRSACQYPIDIYPLPLKALFTIVAPFALTMHVPASWILDNPLYGWPTWTAFVTPLSGAFIFIIMLTMFNFAMRQYRSTGS